MLNLKKLILCNSKGNIDCVSPSVKILEINGDDFYFDNALPDSIKEIYLHYSFTGSIKRIITDNIKYLNLSKQCYKNNLKFIRPDISVDY